MSFYLYLVVFPLTKFVCYCFNIECSNSLTSSFPSGTNKYNIQTHNCTRTAKNGQTRVQKRTSEIMNENIGKYFFFIILQSVSIIISVSLSIFHTHCFLQPFCKQKNIYLERFQFFFSILYLLIL